MIQRVFIASMALLAFAVYPVSEAKPLTDAQIRQHLIQESIDSYPGNCPCPYNTARNGSSCGRRSAYSRGGGYSPLCYPKDVTAQMIKEYRQQHK